MQRPFSGSQSSRIPRTRPQRPKTSLGFARRRPAPPSARLCGFDLRDYFRRHGSSAGLHVGVNGRPSGDPALRSYVEDCRLEALLREVHQEMVDEEEEEVGGSKVSLRERAPLCWESQVRRSEARSSSTHIHYVCIYSGTSLIRTPMIEVVRVVGKCVLFREVSSFQNLVPLYVYIPQVTVRVPYSGEVNSGMTVTHSTADTAAESDRDKIIHTPSPPKLDAHHTKRSAANLEIEKKQPFVTPEGRCQCAEMEDEDTTDLRGYISPFFLI